ncbi:MAG: hsp70 family protein [Rhodoferax sp.]|uniref:Hsp70 family protein n=1 Tax=Rhodoferax sp. TaxID=50421 RepID=UPI0017A8E181|nr:Hsp70 family protein [Rhodoferax sp.]NMM13139.1 hsp70 family protein [Rhodoferax sp.]
MHQYLVGIDLGTTNTVVAYAPVAQPPGRGQRAAPAEIKLFEMEQLIAPGQVAARPLLPSVRYHAAPGEIAEGELQLPWPTGDDAARAPVVMGQWARQLGAQVPGRLVSSAKSWLSHTAVDRLAPILPWGAPAEGPKVSPVEASASYLSYVRAAWNAQHPQSPLEQQDIVLTVPASFDEGARALTLSAARQAGLPKLRLLEEPQAVFYDWLLRHRSSLADELAQTRLVLVCDVGGGTTDLSLIKVELLDGQPQLTRIGVGKHLMLGGDNMDLALAHAVEARMAASAPAANQLSASRLAQLMERCRAAKEQLLAADAPAQTQVTLLGGGARMIGGSRSVTLTRDEVVALLVDGFFPQVAISEPAKEGRSGIVAFGLPYARDPAITRHIADFLRQHAQAMPDTLLLNGGVFRADALVQRLAHTLEDWRGAPLRLLHNDNPDVAVARGAVAYALAQQGLAPSIGGGSARSYFLRLDDGAAPTDSDKQDTQGGSGRTSSQRGICILPRGSEPGQEVLLKNRTFALRVGQPVRFNLLSTTAETDHKPPQAGELVMLADDNFVRLPPIAIVLEATPATNTGATAPFDQKNIAVQLATSLTEVGTLEMHCVSLADPRQRWLLEFDLRHTPNGVNAATGSDPMMAARLREAVDKIDRIFGPGSKPVTAKEVKQLRAQLEHILGERERWATPELRYLFDALWARARGRRRSAEHERVWLNLAGYCLRPGFGDALDAWRVQQLWTQFAPGVQFASDKQVCVEWWTLWRRVAGGLAAPEQLRLLDDFAFNLHQNEQGSDDSVTKPVKGSDEDMLRLGASLERIPVAYKVEIGEWLLGRIHKSMAAAVQGRSVEAASDARNLWALGRIGARQPFYGNTHDVVPAETAVAWVETLLALDWKHLEPAAFAATHLARMTNDRTRDLPLALRERIMARLVAINAPSIWIDMVRQRVELDAATERRVLGESLPPGLKLMA